MQSRKETYKGRMEGRCEPQLWRGEIFQGLDTIVELSGCHRELTIWFQLEPTSIIEHPLLTVVQVSRSRPQESAHKLTHAISIVKCHPWFPNRGFHSGSNPPHQLF